MLRITSRSLALRQLTSLSAPTYFTVMAQKGKIASNGGGCGCGCGGALRCVRMPTLTVHSRRFYCAQKKAEEGGEKAAADAKTAAADGAPEGDVKEDELKTVKSQLLYALADAENARRVAAEDVRKARDFSVKNFAKDMCDVMDSLERATTELGKLSAEDKIRLKNVTQGIELTLNVLNHNLERHGVRRIKANVGDVFDYNVQEALYNHTIKEGEKLAPGQIAAIVKTGYTLHNRVLRAAQVGVAQAPES